MPSLMVLEVEVRRQVSWAKIKVSGGLCSFWGLQGESISVSSFWKPHALLSLWPFHPSSEPGTVAGSCPDHLSCWPCSHSKDSCDDTLGFPTGLVGKESACQCKRNRRRVWSLGREDSPGAGNGNPLQYSCLGNFMGWGTWRATGWQRVGQNSVTEHKKKKVQHDDPEFKLEHKILFLF